MPPWKHHYNQHLMSLSLQAVNSPFLLAIDDCLPGIVTCFLCLHYLQSTPSLPPHPLPSSHVCFCTYGIPLLPSSTSSGSCMHTTIAHHTIPMNSSPWMSYPSPSSPAPQRDCVEPTPHLGLGAACQFDVSCPGKTPVALRSPIQKSTDWSMRSSKPRTSMPRT